MLTKNILTSNKHYIICTELTELEKAQGKGDKSEVEFNRVSTIYTGSDPRTTPTTFESTCPSQYSTHRPDSGFRSRTRTPSVQSSGESCTSGVQERLPSQVLPVASNFNLPHVLGQQQQLPRMPYPVYNSVVTTKKEEILPPMSSGGDYRLVSGGVMVPCKYQYPDIIEVDENQLSDVEKDDSRMSTVRKSHHSVRSVASLRERGNGGDSHRTLQQVTECSPHVSNVDDLQPLARYRRVTESCRACPQGCHTYPQATGGNSSSPPIDIPSKHTQGTNPASRMAELQIQLEPKSSLSDRSISSSGSFTSLSLSDTHAENGQHGPRVAATTPKVLRHPTMWDRLKAGVKNFIVSNIGMTQGCDNSMMASVGVKMT